jgi:glucoamylase
LPPNGSISEQFNHTTGESTSASKLTWSFASFVTMAQRRAGQYPPSWGASSDRADTNLTASECRASSYNSTGTYAPAVAAGAPCDSRVLFVVNATTTFGQTVFVAGNVTQLGGALDDPADVILALDPGNYTSERPEWYVDVWLAAGQTVAYRYVLQDGSQYVFEKDENRTVHVAPCGSSQVVTTDDAATFE